MTASNFTTRSSHNNTASNNHTDSNTESLSPAHGLTPRLAQLKETIAPGEDNSHSTHLLHLRITYLNLSHVLEPRAR
jgi:hypothetical protein